MLTEKTDDAWCEPTDSVIASVKVNACRQAWSPHIGMAWEHNVSRSLLADAVLDSQGRVPSREESEYLSRLDKYLHNASLIAGQLQSE